MQQRSSLSTIAAEPERLAYVRTLPGKYPDTALEENEEIIHFLRKGPIMDRALLTGYEDVSQILAQFTADHKRAFSFSTRDWLISVALVIAITVACYLLWGAAG